jgi:peptide chain release factor 1
MLKSIANLLKMTSPDIEPDEEMRNLALEEAQSTLETLDVLRLQIRKELIPHDPMDDQSAILEVRPGVGGQESTLFVGEIARMYSKYCESVEDQETAKVRFQVEEMSSTPTDVTATSGDAFKEVILSIKGKGAYGLLKNEAGVHRVQRVPATQNTGRLQTSTIAVLVLPGGGQDDSGNDIEAEKMDDIVDPKDVKTEVMRSRGAGGQHVNKTESAIRLTHEPTGITVSMQDSRSQHQNRTKAWAILRARLYDRKMREDESQNRNTRRLQVSGMDRSDRIRTYNFPQDRVTDHRISLSSNGLDAILNGEPESGLGDMIEALQEHRDHLNLQALQQQITEDLAQAER